MPTLSDYLEHVEDTDPGNFNCTDENASATKYYYLKDANDSDLRQVIPQILGTSYATPGSHNIFRGLPKAHPYFNYLYADSITEIRGVGPFTTVNADDELEAPAMPRFAMYNNWRIGVHFSPRPYTILPDDKIAVPANGLTWYAPPPAAANVPLTMMYATEWRRYVDFNFQNQNDYVTATQGHSIFKTGSTAEPGANGGSQFPGMPRIFLPNQIFHMIWYKVPVSYILRPDNYLTKFRGYVNQRAFFEYGNSHLFPAGSLLYLGFTPRIYTSPVAQLQKWAMLEDTPFKYVNLDLTFLVTTRVNADEPTQATAYPLPNRNFIPKGHNIQPYFPKKQFYYVVHKNDAGTDPPYFFSVPFEILFTNPAAPQPDPIP